MIILDSTSKSIKVVLTGAKTTADCDIVAAWADSSSTTFMEGSSEAQTNGTTPVTVVASPAASTRRVIKSMSLVNNDTAAITALIKLVNGATERLIAKVTLDVGDVWTLEGTYNYTGSFKGIGANGLRGYSAYEIAVQNGYTGTEEEWLTYIVVNHDHDVGDLVQIFQNGLV